MMTDISDVGEFRNVSSELDDLSEQLNDSINSLNNIIGQAKDYDGIAISAAGKILRSNLKIISSDMKNVSNNINNYLKGINILDLDDFGIDFPLENIGDNVADFVNSTIDTVTKPLENIASSIGDVVDGVIDNIAVSAGIVSGLYNASTNDSISIPVSEYVNSNPKTQSTRNVSDSITERTLYKSPSVRYPDLGQLKAAGKIVISPGDPNVDLDLSVYSNNNLCGFQVTTGNLKYELSSKDYDMICAVVAAESDGTYDDALAVATTIFNRCETSNWVNSYSRDPIQQITAPSQFAVYESKSYQTRLNGNYNQQVSKAVSDCMNGVRNHEYLFYRSNGSEWYSQNMITDTGNRYGYN